jgi:hypothetical protein
MPDMNDRLKREEWDFSSLPAGELIPALLWETHRELEKVEEVVVRAQAWLDGRLSEKKPPMAKDKRAGKRPRHNFNISEAETARIRASSAFGHFIPFGEFSFLHKRSTTKKRKDYDRWIASYIRPLLGNYKIPWLCLLRTERQRLCKIFDSGTTANIVKIGTWWDAVGYFKQHKLDGGTPLKFDYTDYTSVLLTINWSHSKKRILAAIGKILNQCESAELTRIKRWDRRGKKDRDLLVILERFAVMRLLHHYTLSEIKRLLPEAWDFYQNRKWYDDRRQALKDFRSIIGYQEPEKFFPINWETKAQRSQKVPQLPAK